MQKSPNTKSLEAVLGKLSSATADLAKSTDIAVLQLVLRSKLTAAIGDARRTERAAEALRKVAATSAEIIERERGREHL